MRSGRSEHGQVLPIVAVLMAIMVAFAGITIDIGRLWAERRYLQNAADAAALAGCTALIRGDTTGAADSRARQIGNANLARSPAGGTGSLTGTLRYEAGHDGDPSYLRQGVIVNANGTVRVAIESTVPTALARVLGVNNLETRARAMCRTEGRPYIPLLARRYVRAPGPHGGFVDHLAADIGSPRNHAQGQVDTDDVLGYDVRTPASASAPGPEFFLYGPQSKASNESSFHGFVAFDIRDFETHTSRVYLNGVQPGANPSTQRASQGAYITRRYPGPLFPPVTSPAHPYSQVAVIGGMDTAHTVHPFDNKFNVNDEVMLGVYSGTVLEVADFSVIAPQRIDLPANAAGGASVSFSVLRDNRFNQLVNLALRGDNNAANPAFDLIDEQGTDQTWASSNPNAGKFTGRFDINNFAPTTRGTKVTMRDFTTRTVPPGIYTVWIVANARNSGSTINQRTHSYSVPVRVGGATRDFNLDDSILSGVTAGPGGTISLPISVETLTDTTAWGATTPVTLSVDAASLPPGLSPAQVTFTATSVVPNTTGNQSTLNINTSGMMPGLYEMHLRATGVNGAGQPVTHVEEVTIGVGISPGDKKYVEIIGWALFRVTGIGNNWIKVRAISQVYASPDDAGLQSAHNARLVPWQ